MSQWYWSKNKKVFGPVGEEKIISLIQDKKLVHLDMLYGDEASGWKPLFQVEEFASYLDDRKILSDFQNTSMDWVLLKKVKVKKGIEYKQIGPFAVEQVLSMLDEGELNFDDLAWKKNFESWVPISQLDAFKTPLPSSPVIDPDLYKTVVDKKNSGNSEISLADGNIDRYFHDSEMTSTAPINRENFVTESHVNPFSSEETVKGKPVFREDSEFYSLEFTGESKNLKLENEVHELDRKSEKQTKQNQKERVQIKKERTKDKIQTMDTESIKIKKTKEKEKSRKAFDKNKPNDNKIFNLDIEIWQWVALTVVVFSSIVFLYLLF